MCDGRMEGGAKPSTGEDNALSTSKEDHISLIISIAIHSDVVSMLWLEEISSGQASGCTVDK